jgi:hypothetical protein
MVADPSPKATMGSFPATRMAVRAGASGFADTTVDTDHSFPDGAATETPPPS